MMRNTKPIILCQRCKLDTSMTFRISLCGLPNNDGPFCGHCFSTLVIPYSGMKPKLHYNYRIRELIKQHYRKEVDLMQLVQEDKIPIDIIHIIHKLNVRE